MDNSQRCEGCRFWEANPLGPEHLGVCTRLNQLGGTVSTCIEHAEGGRAIFKCSRHFGCTLWGAKREP